MKILMLLLSSIVLVSCTEDLPLPAKQDCAGVNPYYDQAVILVLGQSNAANFGKVKFEASCSNAYNFFEGEQYALKDPLLGADGDGGSAWTPMAEILLANNFANEIIIAPVARGGSSIEQWIPNGNLNHLISETITSLNQSNLAITHVLWHQGESNNTAKDPTVSATLNALAYKQNFQTLVTYLRNVGVEAPVFIATATVCGQTEIDLELQFAQQGVCADTALIYPGPNTDLLDNTYRYDNCHFNEKGLKMHALLWANILLSHQ